MVLAWKRVEANKGSAGVDGLSIEETAEGLKTQWPKIREELQNGQYRPQAVRRVEIPKPGGGVRELGIPTVVDRLIQQALLQVLQPLIDPTFSEFSYGFRPGRSMVDPLVKTKFVPFLSTNFEYKLSLGREVLVSLFQEDLLVENLPRSPVVQGLVRSFRIIELEPGSDSFSGFSR